jgi:Skp family chaperone for outer membrane proteins
MSGLANAQNVKVAVVRSSLLLRGAPGVAERQALLKRETDSFEAEIARMTDSLQRLDQAFKDSMATFSPQVRDQRQKAFETRLESYRRRSDSLRTLAGRRQDDILQPIIDAVNKVLQDVLLEQGYAVILDLDSDGHSVVAFDKNLDITETVLAKVRRITPPPMPATILKAPGPIKPPIPPEPSLER